MLLSEGAEECFKGSIGSQMSLDLVSFNNSLKLYSEGIKEKGTGR